MWVEDEVNKVNSKMKDICDRVDKIEEVLKEIKKEELNEKVNQIIDWMHECIENKKNKWYKRLWKKLSHIV